MKTSATSIVAWAVAGVVIAVGVIMLAVGLATPVEFGWFAYQPLAGEVFTPGNGVILTIGLIAAAFLTGWHVARRRHQRTASESAS